MNNPANLNSRRSHTTASLIHAAKVPTVITIYFWIIKLLTTAMGEATSDYSVHQFNPYLTVAVGGVLLIAVLTLQLSVKSYIAGIYWLTAVVLSITGTMGADVVHVGFGVPYIFSAIFYGCLLLAIFTWWYRSERTLSIHSIYTRKRELFYWATVLATFALGTATGDLTAYSFHLGFLASGLVFGGVFLLPALGYWLFRANAIFTFWFAYIMTRPFGASFADWAAKPHSFGGLNLGDGVVSGVLSLLIVIFVVYLSITRLDVVSRQD
jgi:uncharacterized membrane-anchored protein